MLQYPIQLPPLSIHSSRVTSRYPSSARLSKTPYISSRPSNRLVSIPDPLFPISQPPSRPASFRSSLIEDVLSPGDFVGEGSLLQGETLHLVPIGADIAPSRSLDKEPTTVFQIVSRLGAGSYAMIYLVQEVLSRPPPSGDGQMFTIGQMEPDGDKPFHHPENGREYAIKCLSKANLDEDALAAQMTEVTVHQSLKSHPNIVTLHWTLETSSFLLLVLEYVPGEDLFYFLEQARDHHESDSGHRAPSMPSFLSNINPSQLFSRTRLRLIASMFCQMCDAVAVCHDQQVFHRDIKPENFIVTDGWTILPDGRQERKVIVKLIDFGLSSTDVESSDMDYGSAPYMSYECRNNVAPTYRPRAADVWSLGIILINMLYHCNPWTDTEQGACSSFNLYLRDPVNFFMDRFVGMTHPVAEFFATRIFCVLENPSDDSQRISANEFGLWVKNLPTLLGGHGIQRTSHSSTQGNPLQVSMPVSHRPSSRHPPGCAPTTRTQAIPARTLPRASLCPAYERDEPETDELSTVLDQDLDLVDQPETVIAADDAAFRSTSHQRHRKRGARKGKGATTVPEDDNLATLAGVTQNLARELSKTSTASSKLSAATKASSSSQRNRQSHEPVSMYAIPNHLLATSAQKPSSSRPLATSPLPHVIKKPSKWKLGFGKISSVATASDEFTASSPLDLGSTVSSALTTATNVPSLTMSLNPAQTQAIKTEDESWARARRSHGVHTERLTSCNLPVAEMVSKRVTSPDSNCSGRPLPSGASSIASSNWRASMSTMSSVGTSTSSFTHYSNSSTLSISTVATSAPSTCRRTGVKSASNQTTSSPKNFKPMTDIPRELDEAPRGQYSNAHGDIVGSPPQPRKQRLKQKDSKLDAVNERPQRRDASTSTTDLGFLSTGKDENGAEQEIGASQCSGQDVVGFEAMNIIRNIRKLWKCWCANGEKCILQFDFTGRPKRVRNL